MLSREPEEPSILWASCIARGRLFEFRIPWSAQEATATTTCPASPINFKGLLSCRHGTLQPALWITHLTLQLWTTSSPTCIVAGGKLTEYMPSFCIPTSVVMGWKPLVLLGTTWYPCSWHVRMWRMLSTFSTSWIIEARIRGLLSYQGTFNVDNCRMLSAYTKKWRRMEVICPWPY